MLGPIGSTLPLPLCRAHGERQEGWSVLVGDATSVQAARPAERPTVVRREHHVAMLFDEVASVAVDLTNMVITIGPHPTPDDVDLGSLIVDQVIPRIAADSHLVLHAAAVASADGQSATLVVGPSGTGKSTLAAAWCLNGEMLLGDDTIKIEGATACPSWAGPRLWPRALAAVGLDAQAGEPQSSRSEKRRLGPADGIVLGRRPAVVQKLILMGARSASRVAAVRLISEQALNLGSFDPVCLLDRVTTLVAAVPEIEVREPWQSPGP
jgi:hypothetical protein